MKKFFTSVPFQSVLTNIIYKPVGGAPLAYDKAHSLPILNVINNRRLKLSFLWVIMRTSGKILKL